MFTLVSLVSVAHAGGDVQVISSGRVEQPPGVVHFVMKKPEKGEVDLGLVRATDVSRAGNVTVIEKLYDDLCTTPCALEMPVGWHELRVSTGKTQWVQRVEVRPGEQTFVLKGNLSKYFWGVMLTSLIVTAPVGVPMMVSGAPGAKWNEGPPLTSY